MIVVYFCFWTEVNSDEVCHKMSAAGGSLKTKGPEFKRAKISGCCLDESSVEISELLRNR